MENISLRAYIHKIENQIDNGQIDQAIAHCKHILQTYPKHIDSYRLLGKALLEKQKYGDASDIFQRVLSSVPDDFVSHIGMSMIREDENNLDAAIWHMERAFEVQPSNKAVQDEMRRLYTSRDGVAPPKIRLTRGALVRMYTRGELYNQAIAEILAALSEDPNRVDLEVMLARIYFLLGKKVEATETCSKLITKLPYCYEANKILSEILPGTSREEDQKIFHQRVVDLEPYFAYLNDKTLSLADVPDTLIMMDFLDWDPSLMVDDQPDWAQSIGFALDNEKTSSEDFSSWIDEIDIKSSENLDSKESTEPENVPDAENFTETNQSQEVEEQDDVINLKDIHDDMDDITISTSDAESDQKLPEWFSDAGWEITKESDQNAEKGFSIPPDIPTEDKIENNPEDEEEILPAEIPSWLKAIAPSEGFSNLSEDGDDNEVKNLEDLFNNLEKDKFGSVKNTAAIHWENEFTKDNEPSLEETLQGFEFSSVTSNEVESTTPIESESDSQTQDINPEDLDWIKALTFEDESVAENKFSDATMMENAFEIQEEEEINKQSLDQIINELEENKIEGTHSEEKTEELSDDDWLNSLVLDADKSASLTESVMDQEEEGIPDWIKSVVDDSVEPTLSSASEESESLPDWLSISDENLGSKLDDIKISFDEEDDLSIPIETTIDSMENLDQDLKVVEESYSELLDDKIFADIGTESDELIPGSEFSNLTDENYEALIEKHQHKPQVEGDVDLPIEAEEEEKFVFDFGESELQTEEIQEVDLASDSEEDEMDSALAWMEGLISKQDSAEEFSPSNLEEDIETLPESLSRESSLNDDSGDETVSTPSWLKELEIETGEVPDQDSDQVLEGLSSLVSDSSIETKTTEFSSEMNLDKTNDQDLEDFLDRLETEIDGKKGDFFDQEIEKERVQSGDLTSEETEQPLSQQMEIEQQEEQEEEPGNIESLELTAETSFEEISTVELGDELATTSLEEEVVTEEIFDDEVQGLEILEEIPSPDDELDEHTEEILETTERERDFVSALEEEIEDTQPLKVRDDRLPDLEKANRYLESGNLEESIAIFDELIDGSFELDQIIYNIQNALDHHFPIDINLWQALGDAYLKNNQLQNALDAYSKAEDLLS